MTMPRKEQKDDFADISGLHISRLLPLGLSGKRRPVDDLVDRLGREDAADWLQGALDARLLEEATDLEQLKALKDEGNNALKNRDDPQASAVAMASYFFAIAAALAHHGVSITRQSRQKLDPILLDIARVAPGAWGELVRRAIER